MPSGGQNQIELTQELADEICRLVAINPYGLKRICRENKHIPSNETIRKWLLDKPDFDLAFSRAKLRQTDSKFEEIDEIIEKVKEQVIVDDKGRSRIDPAAVQLGKIAIDAIKFEIGKLNRKKYGDEYEDTTQKTAPLIVQLRREKKDAE